MSIFRDQLEFLQAAGAEIGTAEAEVLASKLINEEVQELLCEPYYIPNRNVNAIKECLDIIYVCAQYLNATIGADAAEKCWDALHANNMSKCIDGKLVKRDDGKILKPDGYRPLDLSEIVG